MAAASEDVEAQVTKPMAPDAPAFDEALLVRVKGKVKRPTKPDEAERSVPINKLMAEIERQSKRMDEIKLLIDLKRDAGRTAGGGGGDARNRMQGYRNEFSAVLKQKSVIREEMNTVLKQRESLRIETKAIRDKMKVVPEEEFEHRIKSIEFDLSHSSLSATDEKRKTDELVKLQAQRPALKQYYELDAAFKANSAVKANVQARLTACDEVLNGIKAREETDKVALDGVRAKADAETSDIPTLNAEKSECWEMKKALRDQVTLVRTEFDARWTEWSKLDRNFMKWQQWDRNQKFEAVRKERTERSDEYKAAEVTLKGELYDSEVFTCDQTLAYLRKFVAAAAKEEAAAVPVAVPEGMKLFKKRDVEDDINMSVKAKKKGNAPKSLAGQAAAAKTAEDASAKAAAAPVVVKVVKMNNNLETLKTFMSLAIDAPVTTADVPGTIEKVEAKKQHFLALRQKAKEAPPPAPKAAAPAPEEEAAEEEEEDFEAADAPEAPADAPQEPEEEEKEEEKEEEAEEDAVLVEAAKAEEEEEEAVVVPAAEESKEEVAVVASEEEEEKEEEAGGKAAATRDSEAGDDEAEAATRDSEAGDDEEEAEGVLGASLKVDPESEVVSLEIKLA